MKILTSIVFAVLGMSFCFADQPMAVDIVDHSKPDAPIRTSGQTQITEKVNDGQLKVSFAHHFDCANVSNKTIIAFVNVINYANSYHPLIQENQELDAYFFHELEIAPGKKYSHDHHQVDGEMTGPIREGAKRGSPHAEAEAVFVQFADGSTWGVVDNEHVRALLNTRNLLLQTLKQLNAAADKGESDFVSALKQVLPDERADQIIDRIRTQQKENGSPAAIQKIRDMLAVAASR